ncbi:MAG: ABC transporter permease [Candidatus Ornithospirochaeta sp.]|nr:ABC transporter permease [Sphaerochaetaceae bacterium]MDY5523945.1 ABC transporter permease [Candidatus Ornithospirochaeta sp.]
MAKYICKRILNSVFTLCIVLFIVFVLLRQMPVEGYFSNFDKMSDTAIEVSLQNMGLTEPVVIQFVHYIGQVLKGDMGVSNRYRRGYSIEAIIAKKAPVSIRIGLISLVISLTAGVILGILMARSSKTRWKLFDKCGTVFIVIAQAVPAAVYCLLIQLYGTKILGVSMLFNESRPSTWILPVLSLSIGNIAYYAMWLRRYMVDESNKDYVRFARAKGVNESKIVYRHILRNAIVPLAQYIPQSILLTIAGSIYVENLYSVPGMGGLLIQVIKMQDNTMVQALVLIYASVSILGLLVGDLVMALLDPRIMFTKKEGARQ